MIALLTTLAPLIIQAGSWLIGLFIKDQQAKQDALNAYYAAIQAHINDALQSVVDHNSAADQVAGLKQETNKD